MSRPTTCLMDAGCLREASSAHRASTGEMRRLLNVFDLIRLWCERSRQRRELRVLADDAVLLKDVGLSGYDVRFEARKRFWQA